MSKILLTAITLALIFWHGVAFAQSSVIVTPFTGAKKKTVRDRVVKALETDGVTVVEADAPDGDDDEAYRALAEGEGAVAIVGADIEMSKKGWRANFVVRSGVDGSIIEEPTIKGAWLPGLLKAIDKELSETLAPALGQAAQQMEAANAEAEEEAEEPEPEAEPEPAEAEPEADRPAEEADEDDADDGKRPAPIGVRLGVRVFGRSFSYNQDVNSNLRPYSIDPSPAGVVGLEWYPGAHFTDSPVADLGVVGSFERSVGASSSLEGGNESFATTMGAWDAGLRYRVRVGAHEIGVSGRYGQHRFEVEGDTDPNATSAAGMPVQRDLFPDVTYTIIRPGLDVRLLFGKAIVGAHGGYRVVQSMGDLQDDAWFPNATAMAIDAGLFGGYALGSGFNVLVGADFTRYGLDMQSDPDDLTQGRDVAGGAVDQYLSGFAGVEWRPAGS